MSYSVAPRLPIPNPFSTECLILLQAGCLWAALFQQISFQSVATKLLPHNATDSLEFRRNEAVYGLSCCNRKLFLLQTAGLALGPAATDSGRPDWHLQRCATDSTRAPGVSQPYIRDGRGPEVGTGTESQKEGLSSKGPETWPKATGQREGLGPQAGTGPEGETGLERAWSLATGQRPGGGTGT